MKEDQICLICGRELGSKNISKHHLIPKSRGGRDGETIMIHNICHQKIHSVFTEKELSENYNTVDKLRASEEISKFIRWVFKKDPSFYQRNRRSRRR